MSINYKIQKISVLIFIAVLMSKKYFLCALKVKFIVLKTHINHCKMYL